jgi:hypothetical protein
MPKVHIIRLNTFNMPTPGRDKYSQTYRMFYKDLTNVKLPITYDPTHQEVQYFLDNQLPGHWVGQVGPIPWSLGHLTLTHKTYSSRGMSKNTFMFCHYQEHLMN